MAKRKPKPALSLDADRSTWTAIEVEQRTDGPEAGGWVASLPDTPGATFEAPTKHAAAAYAQAFYLRVLAQKLEQIGRPVHAIRFAEGPVGAAAAYLREALAAGPLTLPELAKGAPFAKAILRAARPRAGALVRAVPGDPRGREWYLAETPHTGPGAP
jgi:hypothetical protein